MREAYSEDPLRMLAGREYIPRNIPRGPHGDHRRTRCGSDGEYSADPRRILRRSEGVLENMLGSYENTTNLIEGS